MFQITVNGESQNVPEKQSVESLLTFLNLPAERVAVELNKTLIRKRDWQETMIPSGAEIEIVEFVGGG